MLLEPVLHKNFDLPLTESGGGGGIRTPGTLSGPTVFKTAGFNRSPTPPFVIICHNDIQE